MSIQTDDSTNSISEEVAEAAILESLDGKAKGHNEDDKDPGEEADPDEADDGDDQDAGDDEDGEDSSDEEDEGEEGPDEEDPEEPDDAEDKPSKEAKQAADDQIVQVSVNGETKEFTVGSLKRLAGQEASLTRKSQEADLVGGRAAATIQAALAAVEEDLAPYANQDWMVLQSELPPEEFKWHRENAKKAEEKYQRLLQTAKEFEYVVSQRQQTLRAEEAQAAVAELTQDIPDWNDKLYTDIMTYGVQQGLDESDVANITNAKVIKLLRKAMLYDRGQKVATKKVKAAPNKVIKGTVQASGHKASSTKKAEHRLSSSGSEDDAVAVLLGRWSNKPN